MGFIPDIERIVSSTPFTRQTLFFSATMPPEIVRLSDKFLSKPGEGRGRAPRIRGADHHAQRLIATGHEARGQARDACAG